MQISIEIRESVADDLAEIESIYPEAFPDENLLPLVRDLLRDASSVWSLVAIVDSTLAAHVLFTKCSVPGIGSPGALLGPLAVAPARQRRGIGSTLVRAGFRMIENEGVCQVYVLGDPAYYRRLGFEPESCVAPPYPLPAEWSGAWQARTLCGPATRRRGTLSLPRPWLHPALWGP